MPNTISFSFNTPQSLTTAQTRNSQNLGQRHSEARIMNEKRKLDFSKTEPKNKLPIGKRIRATE